MGSNARPHHRRFCTSPTSAIPSAAMSPFAWGLLAGCLLSVSLAAIVGVFEYRRLLALERRAIQAERLAEIGSLTGGLAHEIKNPLSTVQLNLQLLQEDLPPDNPAYTRPVNRIQTVP